MNLSIKLRELRVAARLTQAEVAELAGVSRKTISSIESDYECGNVTLPILSRVLDVLGAKVDIVSSAPPNLDDLLQENKEIFSGKNDVAPRFLQRVKKKIKSSNEKP